MKKKLGSLLMVSKECQSPKMYDEIKEIKIKTLGQLLDYVETEQKAKELLDYITNLQEENKELKRFNRIRENYFQLIADIGYDYDGMNTIDGLKGLVDELCKYALWGRDLYDYEPIYENNGKVYNILDEEIQGSDKE